MREEFLLTIIYTDNRNGNVQEFSKWYDTEQEAIAKGQFEFTQLKKFYPHVSMETTLEVYGHKEDLN